MNLRLSWHWLGLLAIVLIIGACSNAAEDASKEGKSNVAPVTSIIPNQKYISATRQISFECRDTDANDYCKATYYSFNQSPASDQSDAYLGSFTFANVTPMPVNLATITVRYYSVDSFDHKEKERQQTFIFDVDAPKTQNISLQPPAGNFSDSQWIHFNCIDDKLDLNTEGSGCHLIYYALVDVGAPAPALEAFKVIAYPEGQIQINRDSTLYYFAEDVAGNKSIQQSANYTFTAPIANISNLNTVSGNAQVNLTWTLPTPLGNIEGIKVVRNENNYPANANDGVTLSSALIDHYTDTNLINGHTYYYAVYAYTTMPSTLYSVGETVAVTPQVFPPPSDVLDFQLVAGDGQISLNWVLPLIRDNYSHVEIRRDIGTPPLTNSDGAKVFTSESNPEALSAVDKPLTNNMVYYYRIFVVDKNGRYSNGVAGSAKAINAKPGTLVNFKAIAGDGLVDLNWGNPSDTDLAAVYIRRKQDAPPANVSDGEVVAACSTSINTTTCRDNSVINGVNYYYAGFAQDNSGQYSDLVVYGPVLPLDKTPPAPVSNLTANVGDATVLLSWVNPSDVDFAATKVIRSSQSYVTDASVNGPTSNDSSIFVINLDKSITSFSDNGANGLQNNISYFYSVFSKDLPGNYSVSAATINATPVGDTLPPELVATLPAADATNVSPLLPVSVDFSETIAADSLAGNFTLSDGNGAIPGLARISSTSSASAEFIPDAGRLPLLTTISASLTSAITDLSGNPLRTGALGTTAPFNWSFTTADGSWSAFSTISAIRAWAITSTVAFDAKGQGLAVWSRNIGTADVPGNNEIVARRYNPESGWGSNSEFVNCYTVDVNDPTLCLALRSGTSPEMAMDAAGNAIVIWESSAHVYANRYVVGSGWSLPINLHINGNPIDSSTPPKLVLDSQSMVTVAWPEYSQASTGSRLDIMATRFSLLAAANQWNDQLSSPQLIEWNDESNADGVQLSVDNAGNVLALWFVRTDAAVNIRNAMYNYFHSQADGSMNWDQPAALPSASQLNTHPHPVLSNNSVANAFYNINVAAQSTTGDAIALWCHPQNGSTTAVLWADYFNAQSATWQGAVAISDLSGTLASPRCASTVDYVRLAMGDDGRAIALWISTAFTAQVNRFMPNLQQWQGVQTLPSVDVRAAKVTLDAEGHALAMLSSSSGEVDVYRLVRDIAWDAAALSQASIQHVVAYPSTGTVASRPVLGVDKQGNALALWTHDVQTSGPAATLLHDYTLRASYFGYTP